MTQFITFGEIADIATSDDEGSRVLDGIVFRKMTEIEGDDWQQMDADGFEDVWHRRDPEDSVAFDTPPKCSTSLDAVRTTMVHGMRLDRLEQDKPGPEHEYNPKRSWRAWVAVDVVDTTFIEQGATAELAWLSASMRAHAFIAGEEGLPVRKQ